MENNKTILAFRPIAAYDNYLVANMTLGMLQENGINCHLKDEYIVTVDPFLNNAVGGIKLMVDDVDRDKALELIKQAEIDYLKDVPCPHCGNLALGVEEKIDHPASIWTRLKNLVTFGQESTYSKYYRCSSCSSRVDELPLMS